MTASPRDAQLRFPESQIVQFADRYKYADDAEIVALRPSIVERGYLVSDELYQVSDWKAARNKSRVRRNSEDYIREITRFSLHTTSERARIESLRILDGVEWPMASVILHFFHSERYPILDFRALWSIGVDEPNNYDFAFWWEYVSFCRDLADRASVDMRTLDRALWQYSSENQPPSGT
jgi:hypothetical protein